MKFRKRPIVIEAVQWDGDANLANRVLGEAYEEDWDYTARGESAIEFPTLEGVMRAEVGDWIITGIKGEKYPCKPDIFEATYEAVDEQVGPPRPEAQEEDEDVGARQQGGPTEDIGAGSVPNWKPCPTCEGWGTLWEEE